MWTNSITSTATVAIVMLIAISMHYVTNHYFGLLIDPLLPFMITTTAIVIIVVVVAADTAAVAAL